MWVSPYLLPFLAWNTDSSLGCPSTVYTVCNIYLLYVGSKFVNYVNWSSTEFFENFSETKAFNDEISIIHISDKYMLMAFSSKGTNLFLEIKCQAAEP